MFHKFKSDYLNWIILIGGFFLLLDVFFFNRGLIFSLFVATGMIYLGKKRMPKKSGKLLFWMGLFFLIVNIMNMMTFRLLIMALLLILIIQYANKKKEDTTIKPTILEPAEKVHPTETIVKEQALFQNHLFGQQQTPEHVYEWEDINIQTGIGDTIIDLSNTVLPKGESTIFIRNLIGKITILIPYDIEISAQHSALFGSVQILNVSKPSSINRSIKVQTADYEEAAQKVKIFTSMIVGDIEVKRI